MAFNVTAEAVPSRSQYWGQRRISKSYRWAGPAFGCDFNPGGVVDLLGSEEANMLPALPNRFDRFRQALCACCCCCC